MANGKNEAECWTCAHFSTIGERKLCAKHKLVLPVQLGPYLICKDWQHYSNPESTAPYYKEHYFTKVGVLYRYNIYAPHEAKELGEFSQFREA